MTGALYTTEILRLATSIPYLGQLAAPDARAEQRAPVCGSRVSVDVVLGADGAVSQFAQTVKACALGQASAAILGGYVVGRSAAELTAVRDALVALLAGQCELVPELPALDMFIAARPHSARHASILLPFAAAAEAVAVATNLRQSAEAGER